MTNKEKLFDFPNFNIELESGPITKVDVDVIINSANGTMIHGSGTAADISNASGKLTEKEMKEYSLVVKRIPGIAGKVYQEIWKLSQEGKYHQPTRLQLECAKFFLTNNGDPLAEGQIALTTSGDLEAKKGAKWIIHAVGMTYDYKAGIQPETGRPPIIPAKPAKIKKAILKSLNFLRDKNLGNSVAIPIMCTRKGGVTPRESLQAIKEGIMEHLKEGTNLRRIVIVGDNPKTAEFIARLS